MKNVSVSLKKGLTVLVDQHSNEVTPGSVFTNSKSFKVLINSPHESPAVSGDFQVISPGHEHFLHVSPVSVVADSSIKSIQASKRKCLFKDEMSLLFHNSYTFQSCLFECHLLQAFSRVQCIPWSLPHFNDTSTCDPFETKEFLKWMEKAEDRNCSHCLDDCTSVKYKTISTSSRIQ